MITAAVARKGQIFSEVKDRARTMFFICKDSCMCTAPPGHGGQDSAYANPTVLYCFGEVSRTIRTFTKLHSPC